MEATRPGEMHHFCWQLDTCLALAWCTLSCESKNLGQCMTRTLHWPVVCCHASHSTGLRQEHRATCDDEPCCCSGIGREKGEAALSHYTQVSCRIRAIQHYISSSQRYKSVLCADLLLLHALMDVCSASECAHTHVAACLISPASPDPQQSSCRLCGCPDFCDVSAFPGCAATLAAWALPCCLMQ